MIGAEAVPTLSLLSERLRAAAKGANPARARSSFLDYLRHVARDAAGKGLREDPYTHLMADVLVTCHRERRHLSHIAFPGLGKSTLLQQFGCFEKGLNPRSSTVIISADQKVAVGFCSLIREVIQTDAYRSVFPHIVPDNSQAGEFRGKTMGWEKHRLYLRHSDGGQNPNAAFEAVAAVPKGEARRVHVLMADDVMTRLIANSREQRETLKRSFRQTWLEGRLSNGGWCVALQNCWHQEDLAHDLLRDPRFCSVWVGITASLDRLMVKIWNPPAGLAILSDPDAFGAEPVAPSFHKGPPDFEFTMPLPDDPELYSPQKFREKERADATTFRQLYRLQAASSEDRMFPHWPKRKLFEGTVAEMLGVPEESRLPVFTKQTDQMRLAFGAGMDISSPERPGDAIWFGAKDQQGNRYPIEHHRGNFDAAQVCAIIESAWRRGIRFAVFYVENNATQGKFLEEIRAHARGKRYEWASRIQGWTTGKNKFDPLMGLPVLDVLMQGGSFVWPAAESLRTDAAHAEAWRLAEGEFAECPKFPKPGETGDSVMAWWFCDRALEGAFPSGGRSVAPASFSPASAEGAFYDNY